MGHRSEACRDKERGIGRGFKEGWSTDGRHREWCRVIIDKMDLEVGRGAEGEWDTDVRLSQR